MKSLIRFGALAVVLVLVAFVAIGCGDKRTRTVITETHTTQPAGPPQEVIVGDQPTPPPPPPPPPSSGGSEVLVPDEGDVIIPK